MFTGSPFLPCPDTVNTFITESADSRHFRHKRTGVTIALHPGRIPDRVTPTCWESAREEHVMFAAIRRYHTDPDSIEEVARRVNEGFVPLISDLPGFVVYIALNAGQGEYGTVSVFEDQASAEESNRVAEQWVNENLSELLPAPEFAAGEVVAYKAK
jgi:hypothetical protein